MEVFATALPALDAAFGMILQPHVIGFLVLGVVMGLCIGVFPGLGGIAGLSLLLPFMFGMEPVAGLALMIGMVAFIVDVPQSITDSATVLPVQIFLWSDSPERAFVEKTSAAIMVLLVFLVFMNTLAVLLRKKLERRW